MDRHFRCGGIDLDQLSMTSRLARKPCRTIKGPSCNKKQNKLSLHIEREETTRWECTDLATNFAVKVFLRHLADTREVDQYQVTPSFQPAIAKRVAVAESSATMVIDRVTPQLLRWQKKAVAGLWRGNRGAYHGTIACIRAALIRFPSLCADGSDTSYLNNNK